MDLVEGVEDRAESVAVPVALEKDVEERDEVIDEGLVALLGRLGEARDVEFEEVVEQVDPLDVGGLIHLRLVENVERLDGLECEDEARG